MTKRLPQLADINDCTGCMACVDSCNKSAIKSYRGEDGHLYVHVEQKLCVGCLQCEKICQGREKLRGNNDLKQSKPYASWALDDQLRSKSTSGGVFAAIARKIILEGGVVVGASFDGRYAKHIVIDCVDELIKLQGSKYVHSNTEGIYQEIKKHLPDRKVLFSGVGCQAAAVLSFFSNHPNKNNLYTIDLICGGVPSDILIEKYYATKPELEAITSFRTKRKYELKGEVDGVEQTLGKQALPLAGFAAELTNRFSCYHCQFAYAHRMSDITIGDLWGNLGFEEEKADGISLAIAHNERGRILLEGSYIEKQSIEWSCFLQHNHRLFTGFMPLPLLRKQLPRNAKVMSNGLFTIVYSSAVGIMHPFLFLDRCYRALYKRVNEYIVIYKVKKMLSK